MPFRFLSVRDWSSIAAVARLGDIMSLSEVKNETQTLEFKQSWCDEYLEWICGYADACGGTCYIGRRSVKGRRGAVK